MEVSLDPKHVPDEVPSPEGDGAQATPAATSARAGVSSQSDASLRRGWIFVLSVLALALITATGTIIGERLGAEKLEKARPFTALAPTKEDFPAGTLDSVALAKLGEVQGAGWNDSRETALLELGLYLVSCGQEVQGVRVLRRVYQFSGEKTQSGRSAREQLMKMNEPLS